MADLETRKAEILGRLLDFVSIPSVSADPSFEPAMAEARALLTAWLNAIGLSNVQTLDAGGHAAVYGEWMGAADRPTVLLYGHYDVQPPDPLELWHSPPFEPQIRDGRIFGRGVSDDKGPSSIALETVAAFLRVEGGLPVNVKILIEGEEEIGSATLGDILRKHRELIRADAVVSADGARWRSDLTTVNIGSRGIAGFEFTVQTAAKDLHSGRFGGAVPNAAHVMAGLVADLHGPDGEVAVPGFYEGVGDIREEERRALRDIPFDEEQFFAGLAATPFGEPGHTTLERLWLRPCLDVNGMWSGYTGAGGKTVIPSEAQAKVTMRLVPGQDPDGVCRAVKDFIAGRCPAGAAVRFSGGDGQSAAYELPLDHPLLRAVEHALAETHGSCTHRIRIGGTLPVSDIVHRELGIHTVMFSFSTADEDFHAPNEFFRLSSIDEGLRAWTALLRRLADFS